MTTDVKIILILAGFFALLAMLTFMRLLLRREPPTWKRLRLGVFVERDPDEEDNE